MLDETERRRWLLLVIGLIISMGALGLFNVIYTNSVDQAGQQDLCALVESLDSDAPATTERGRQQQDAVRHYRARRC